MIEHLRKPDLFSLDFMCFSDGGPDSNMDWGCSLTGSGLSNKHDSLDCDAYNQRVSFARLQFNTWGLEVGGLEVRGHEIRCKFEASLDYETACL